MFLNILRSLLLFILEDHELVSKVIDAVVPPKVKHSLTDFGKTLILDVSVLRNSGDENGGALIMKLFDYQSSE